MRTKQFEQFGVCKVSGSKSAAKRYLRREGREGEGSIEWGDFTVGKIGVFFYIRKWTHCCHTHQSDPFL
jgi:hypothetical protein